MSLSFHYIKFATHVIDGYWEWIVVAECKSGCAAITTRIPKRYKVHIKRMLKRYKSQYTVMKSILIDIQRSNADLISYVNTMYPYPELSGVCIRFIPKASYATIADQFRVISKQFTTPHTVCLRAVNEM